MKAPPQDAINAALQAARLSPCAKSKRGVCAYGPTVPISIVSTGYNGPPTPMVCDGSPSCRAACGQRCVHAEMRALRKVAELFDLLRRHVRLVHVKIDDQGELVAGGGPSCWQCSREVLDIGIAGVWLYEAQRWHDEVPCGTCNRKTIIPHDAGTTGVCEYCKAAGRLPGLLELGRGKTIYAADGVWRYHNAFAFHCTTLETCAIGGPT